MSAGPPTLDLLSMARAQQEDAGVQAYRTAITRLVLADLPIPGTDATLLCDISTGVSRPIVSLSWQRVVFQCHPRTCTPRHQNNQEDGNSTFYVARHQQASWPVG